MSRYTPVYEAIVYDEDDATEMAPIAGADHTDKFIVTTHPWNYNRLAYSDTLGSWTPSGSPTVTNQYDTWSGYGAFGGIDLTRVQDNNGTLFAGVYQDITLNSGQDSAMLSWYMVEPPSPSLIGMSIQLRDQTNAGAGDETEYCIVATVQWANGRPYWNESYSRYNTVLGRIEQVADATDTGGKPLFRAWAYITGLTPTDNYRVLVFPAVGGGFATGDCVIGGVQLGPYTGNTVPVRKQTTASASVASYKPYIESLGGRRGRMDPLSGEPDSGLFDMTLLDARVTAGGDNLIRWVTAFLGNDEKKQRLRGRKVLVLESRDMGISWDYYVTGRISSVKFDESRVSCKLQMRDMHADLFEQDIFVGAPASTATNGFQARVWPLGIPSGKTYGDSNTYPLPTMTVATLATFTDTTSTEYAILTRDAGYSSTFAQAPVALKNLHERQGGAKANAADAFAGLQIPQLRAKVGGNWYALRGISYVDQKVTSTLIPNRFLITELPSTDPDYASLGDLTLSSSYTVQVFPGRMVPASDDAPILLDAANVEDLIEEILDGDYGAQADDGTALQVPVGHPTYTFDSRTPPFRAIITEPMTIGEFLTEYIAKPLRLGYYLDGAGYVQFTDLRLPASSPASTLTDDSIVSPPTYEISDTVVTKVVLNTKRESQVEYHDPDTLNAWIEEVGRQDGAANVPPHLVREDDFQLIVIGGDNTNQWQELTVDAFGIRAGRVDTTFSNVSEARLQESWLEEVGNALIAAYGWGDMYYTVPCRRVATDGDPEGCELGDLRGIDIDAIPDPGTNRRGGARMGRCIERYVDAFTGELMLTFQDVGLDAQRTVPTSCTIAVLNTNSVYYTVGVATTFTTNAQGDDMEVWYLVSPTSESSQPSETDSRWTFGQRWQRLSASTSYTRALLGIPTNMRCWVRFRSVSPNNVPWEKPSTWVIPTPTYVDIPATAAPTSLASAGVNATSALLTWDIGSTYNHKVVVRISTTTPPADRASFMITLPVGSERLFFDRLTASTTYYWTVAFLLNNGDTLSTQSSVANFTTTATTPDAPDMVQVPKAWSMDLYAS